ncbi:MAG: hypothetical protein K1X68_07705 [Saprospiraceae bacterium]|nr:hypothetical protein [Saprospiraceae bacterium]HMW38266.1 hypothetical protein [Saprospiraceae bacterium]HMX88549.1 hypothetical protein [Saprospiraceae bacterium]HMZ40554.1 hypothetical protein [Saprospiraceae bacterium]HNA64103.1 hypothetical protein [Saprospiraceae bacterium]
MRKITTATLLYFVLGFTITAQSSITVKEDPRITSIMNQYTRINRSITHISGWRVTVITTTDRRVMEQTKAEFQKNFTYAVKWEYKEPYYHLKAGAFLNKNDALSALENIKKKFVSAFISLDKISYTEF